MPQSDVFSGGTHPILSLPAFTVDSPKVGFAVGLLAADLRHMH